MHPPSPALAAFREARVEYADVENGRIAFRRFGSGPPLVMVHGWPVSGATYRHILPALAREYSCIVVDLLGTGSSEWTDKFTFTFAEHAQSVRAVVDALGLESYALLGQDTGATAARLLAASDRRVRALVMANTEIPKHRPPYVPLYVHIAKSRALWSNVRLTMRVPFLRRSALGLGGCFADLSHLDGEFHDLFVSILLEPGRAGDGQRRYLAGIDWNVVDALPATHAQIQVPVLLIWGADDPTFPLALAKKMSTQFPALAGVRVIEGARLLVHEERPEAFAKHALEFLKTLPTSNVSEAKSIN